SRRRTCKNRQVLYCFGGVASTIANLTFRRPQTARAIESGDMQPRRGGAHPQCDVEPVTEKQVLGYELLAMICYEHASRLNMSAPNITTLMKRAWIGRDISERCLAHVIAGVEGVYDQ